MKVAILGDVHANLQALKAVLADISSRRVDAVWNVGDFVGYGANPEEVVVLLGNCADVNTIGNYDRKVLKYPSKKAKWRSSKNAEKLSAFKYAWKHLSEASRRYLASLPAEARLTACGRRVLLVHGSPESDEEPLTDETDERRLAELAEMCDADVVVCGHAHRAMCRQVGGVLFVNTGSVGRPEGSDRRACYATMEIDADHISVEHHRVEYDVDQAVAAIRASGQSEAFAQMVLTGQGYQQVQEAPDRRAEAIDAATALARRCDYDRPHTEQVTRLALELFDKLSDIHGLGTHERFLLNCAALLHDIGWCEGGKGHHKTAMRLILADTTVPLDKRERAFRSRSWRYWRGLPPAGSATALPCNGCWRVCFAWLTGWTTRTDLSSGAWTCRFVRGV